MKPDRAASLMTEVTRLRKHLFQFFVPIIDFAEEIFSNEKTQKKEELQMNGTLPPQAGSTCLT
jgi:hypothetical protein